MNTLQILAIIFALFAFSRAFLLFKESKITAKEFAFWAVIWCAVIVVSVFTKSMAFLSDFLGVERPVDSFIYLSILLLFYLVYRIYAKLDSIDQEITTIVRKVSYKKKK